MATLEELQAEFPHGSKWRLKRGHTDRSRSLARGTSYPFTVVGWSDGDIWFMMGESGNSARVFYSETYSLERVPDLPVAPPEVWVNLYDGDPEAMDTYRVLHLSREGADASCSTWRTGVARYVLAPEGVQEP